MNHEPLCVAIGCSNHHATANEGRIVGLVLDRVSFLNRSGDLVEDLEPLEHLVRLGSPTGEHAVTLCYADEGIGLELIMSGFQCR